MVYLRKPLWLMVFIFAGVIYGSDNKDDNKESHLNNSLDAEMKANDLFNFPMEKNNQVSTETELIQIKKETETELIQIKKEIIEDDKDTDNKETHLNIDSLDNKMKGNDLFNLPIEKNNKVTTEEELIQIKKEILDNETRDKTELEKNKFPMENIQNNNQATLTTTKPVKIEKEIMNDDIQDKIKLAKLRIELTREFNKKLGEKLARYCTTCSKSYAANKLFQVYSKNDNECFSCITKYYPFERINLESFKYKDIALEKFYDSQNPYKDGYVLYQLSANAILCVASSFMWANGSEVSKHASGFNQFSAATLKLLPFTFGANFFMTIAHMITKYGSRMRHASNWKEFPLSIIPERGAFFQLFIAVVSAIFYWGLQEHDMTEKVVAIYGFFLTLSLWTGQNLSLELHTPIYVNDWEFGFQKWVLKGFNKPISQSTLKRAWIQDKDAWNLAKPFFVFYQLFISLNFVASCSLMNHLVHDPTEFGEGMEGVYVGLNLGIWITIALSLLIKLMMGVDQGPVFSMASISRLGMMSAYAGLNTMSLYTKALMNLTSIMFMMIGLVVPWDKLFPNIYERIRF